MRPPLWLSLVLLIIAGGTFAYARYQRAAIDRKLAFVFQPSPDSPEELNVLRKKLAATDLTRKEIAKQLDAQMEYLRILEGSQFYLTIDATSRTADFRIGRDVVREMNATFDRPLTRSALSVAAKTSDGVILSNGARVTLPAEDFAAIQPRISKGTRVYVF